MLPVLRTGGIAISLTILLIGILRLAWVATHARELTAGRWVDLTTEISGIYGLRRHVTILQSDHPSLLVTWGLARPKVILPSSADEWSDDRARVVMSHELAHISRGDWIVQLSAELLRAFYWFNPLMWIACRRLRLESEHACDDEVMSRGVEGSEYATHLIELARALNRNRYTWYPAPAMARPSSLERRVRAMLNTGLDRGPLTGAARALIFVLLLGITAAVAAAQSGFFTFTGRIADEQGRDVSGVKVVLANEVRQAKYEVKTGESGRFEFVGLPPGDYALEAQGIGFQSVKDMLTISGQNVQRSYTLKLGRLQETINIRFNPERSSGTRAQRYSEGGGGGANAGAEGMRRVRGRRAHRASKENQGCPPILSDGPARHGSCGDGRARSADRCRWVRRGRQAHRRRAARPRAVGDSGGARVALHRDVAEL